MSFGILRKSRIYLHRYILFLTICLRNFSISSTLFMNNLSVYEVRDIVLAPNALLLLLLLRTMFEFLAMFLSRQGICVLFFNSLGYLALVNSPWMYYSSSTNSLYVFMTLYSMLLSRSLTVNSKSTRWSCSRSRLLILISMVRPEFLSDVENCILLRKV
jgi:hypothetical protein